MSVSVQARSSGIAAYIHLLRPHQWTKNAFCLAGVFFSGHFRHTHDVLAALATFACFCAASSAIYVLNDVLDRERDAQHPIKSRRPLVSGAISVSTAMTLGIVLSIVAIAGAIAIGAFAVANHAADSAPDTPSPFVMRWAVLGCVLLYLVNNTAY
jgi:4-hydroxybenzoate polyprenyltransferase